jgi:WD40 repeat protein
VDPSGTLAATAGEDGRLRLLDIRAGAQVDPEGMQASDHPLTAVDFSTPHGRWLCAADASGSVVSVDLADLSPLSTRPAAPYALHRIQLGGSQRATELNPHRLSSVHCSPSGVLLAGSWDSNICEPRRTSTPRGVFPFSCVSS